MSQRIRVVNLEMGMPTVEEARNRLISEIQNAASNKVIVLKIIHGYGSTGVGGKIKTAVQKLLPLRKKDGKIRAYVCGENWSIFDETSREIIEVCPEMKKDRDLEQGNPGISIILLKG